MTIKYYEKYKNKTLNEVVLMGSHDAAIASGGSNAKTQDYDIFGQANYGARFFDLRVAAFKTSFMGGKVELRSYHDATKKSSPTFRLGGKMKVADLNSAKHGDVKAHTTVFGVAGFGLQAMLQDAKLFLSSVGKNEFLIFKFDKSENWMLIYETCMDELDAGGFLYKNADPQGRNLNTKTLEELKGKVLILFPHSAFATLPVHADEMYRRGFLGWKNLYSKAEGSAKTYVANFSGLQYYGKGGVSHNASGDTGKINQNSDIQNKLMKGQGSYKVDKAGWKGKLGMQDKGEHAGVDRNVVGLMYWTTTGPSKSGILTRNGKMWTDVVKNEMIDIGLQLSDKSLAGMGTGSAATVVKKFMPNIIMVDFVDSMKGNVIFKMNVVAAAQVANTMEAML